MEKGGAGRKGGGVVVAASGYFGGRGEGGELLWALGRSYVFEVSLSSAARLPERLPGKGLG